MSSIKTYLLIILGIFLCTNSIAAQNKAYKGIKDINLVDELTGRRKTLVTVEKGDTLYANEATYQYLQENEGNTMHYLPLEYKGITGYADSHLIYPIKLSDQDTLKFLQTKRIEDRTVQERLLVPAIDWTMNTVTDFMTWFWFIVFSLVGALIFFVASFSDKLKSFGLIMVGFSLSAASICEFFYILHATRYVIWFVYPSVVGGWGHVILNFIIFSALCGVQAGLYYYLAYTCITGDMRLKVKLNKREEDFDDDEEDDESPNSFFKNLGVLPILIGFALMILMWVDYFTGSKMSGTPYIVLISLLGVGGIIELVYLFKYKMWTTGLLMPIFYIVGGIGLAGIVMILGMLAVLIVIAGAIFAFLAILAVGALGGLIGTIAQAGKRVEGYDEFGNKVTGTMDAFGDIRGDDGKTYKQKSNWF
ncbi:MAG: hypothetical protein J1F43_07005 [Muribaculaceae bacterium]|nr:hypothetical protein [Muribaculaceae bacterium]